MPDGFAGGAEDQRLIRELIQRVAKLEERFQRLEESEISEFRLALSRIDRQAAQIARSLDRSNYTQNRLNTVFADLASKLADLQESVGERAQRERTQLEARNMVRRWGELLVAMVGVAWLLWSGNLQSGIEALGKLLGVGGGPGP